MSSSNRVALVTGGNRGIGLEVCRQLAGQGLTVVCAARDQSKAEEAARTLGGAVVAHALDVTRPESVGEIAGFVRERFGRLDALVNNAGVFLDGKSKATGPDASVETLRETMETNLYGPLRLAEAFLPMMKDAGHGRVVNVSSQMGQLSTMAGDHPAYRISKAALNALTGVLNGKWGGPDLLINSACPGWVKTDMGGPNAPGTPEQGADTIVWLATLPEGGPSGGFFQSRKRLDW